MRKTNKKAITRVVDAFVNAFTKTGLGKSSYTSWQSSGGFLPIEILTDMYVSDWLSRKIVDVPVDDAIFGQFELSSESDKVDAVQKKIKELNIIGKIQEALKMARLYGGAAIIPVTNNMESAAEEALNGIDGELIGLTVATGSELQPYTYFDDPFDPRYGNVEIWTYQPENPGASSSSRYLHSSRVIAINGDYVPKMATRRALPYPWGQSVLETCYKPIKNYDESSDATINIIHEYLHKVLKMPNLLELLQEDYETGNIENADSLQSRIELMNLMSSGHNMTIIGGEEDMEKFTLNTSGLKELLEKPIEAISGSSGIPVQRLFSQQMGTLAGAKEGTKTYLDLLIRTQDKASSAIDFVMGIIADNFSINDLTWSFQAVDKPSESEIVEIRNKQAQTDNLYYMMGSLSAEEIRQSRFRGDYSIETSVDSDLDLPPAPPSGEE